MQDVTYKTQEFEQIKNLRDNIADKLKNIFAGKSISTVESELKESENKARENLKTKNEEKNKINESLTRVVTQSTKFEQDISQQQEIISNLNREIHFWLENYNKTNNISLTDIELNSLVDYSQQWINNERNDLNNIDKSLNRAETILQERNAKLEDHKTKRLSNRDLVELEELQASESKDLKASRNKFTEIEFCLKEDINNHIVFEEILYKIKEQEIIVNKWASLNEIIGSKSGQKFQLIAQEYTLDILVYYSNEHLKTLNSRYELQCISNSLSLQVIDKDMGNNIRSIYSLSGGETFLVSLALALGLASLSSNQMSVESLFIDEGFGSLDSTTLNIALDALERLHNQGRKVGVISHVHEMTERIPVQIKLTKRNSGRSNLRIIGN
ncbi:hypothetical protein SDC9_95300 [bioreactor metagenome]|uniref:Nuclease SbcCD subunit C n=1 Tax=bioreactor metagenome TaxID=1076179 RepID=A0A645A5W7_9ZZZZ